MTVLTSEFNPAGATNGAQVKTTDTGDLSSWDTVNGTTITYDNTHTLFGKALAAKIVASAATPFLRWDTKFGSTATTYGRFYIYFSSLPSTAQDIILSYQPGVGANWSLRLTASHTLQLFTPSGSQGSASTTVLATGQWYRIEYNFHAVGGAGASASFSIFASPDSNTATETVSVPSATDARIPTAVAYGATSSNTTYTAWLASMVEKGTSAIGPYPVSSTAPTVSGSDSQGSTLTCDGGTWNSGATFTLTYQWTRDGSNIGGATSSTYVTQAADVGHAVGCKVTATGTQATNESATQASSNTITVTGASTTYSDSPSGTITLSGSSTGSQTRSFSSTASVTFAGIQSESWETSTSPSVAFALTGSITASLVRAVAVTGTITLDGTADSALLTHRPSFRVRVGSPGHGWEVGAPR